MEYSDKCFTIAIIITILLGTAYVSVCLYIGEQIYEVATIIFGISLIIIIIICLIIVYIHERSPSLVRERVEDDIVKSYELEEIKE